MPSARTPRTISSTRSNCGPCGTSRHAAPMQKRVAPCSRARRAAASVSSTLSSSSRTDARLVMRRLRAVGAILRAAAGLDAEQHAALHFIRTMVLAMNELGSKNQIQERSRVDGLNFIEGPIVPHLSRGDCPHGSEFIIGDSALQACRTASMGSTLIQGLADRYATSSETASIAAITGKSTVHSTALIS